MELPPNWQPFHTTVARNTVFSEFARSRLRSKGFSQKLLAERLGVSPAYVSQILCGKKNPPDLGKERNRWQLAIWAECIDATEEEILDVIRFELHRVPPRPHARFPNMRRILLARLKEDRTGLADDINALEFHPTENLAIQGVTQLCLIVHEPSEQITGYDSVRFKDVCRRVASTREFVEGQLVEFVEESSLLWTWDSHGHEVRFLSDAAEIHEAIQRTAELLGQKPNLSYPPTVPVVGHVSAGEGFEYTDGGFPVGEGFEQVELPPGIAPSLADRFYCVRVRGNSLREFFGDGTLLFIKPESWEEVKDGDLVIFKDRQDGRAFVKKVEFAGDNVILKPMNPMYNNIVLRRSDLMLLERVAAIIL